MNSVKVVSRVLKEVVKMTPPSVVTVVVSNLEIVVVISRVLSTISLRLVDRVAVFVNIIVLERISWVVVVTDIVSVDVVIVCCKLVEVRVDF